jgi:L-asparagine oxygenase
MSAPFDIKGPPDVFTLGSVETKALEQVANDFLAVAGDEVGSREWTAASGDFWHDVPAGVRKRVGQFRRDSGESGALLVRALPVDESSIPDTPRHSGSVQREATVPAALLSLFASGLGDPVAFRAEKSGALVQDVVPVPGNERFQGNEGSVVLSFHNENAFHPHRPDHVLLLCLRADHDRVAGLRVASIRRAYPLLSDRCQEALFRTDFVTAPPPSFGGGAATPPHAVCSGDPADPDIVIDFAATKPLHDAAGDAMRELGEALEGTSVTFYLAPGDMAVVDNHITLHGRTAFTPRYDGRDRWLQRSFSLRDLRVSRHCRPGDGHVLAG